MRPVFRAIDHVQLAMPSGGETAATGFYAGILGLSRVQKPAVLMNQSGCWFTNGIVALHLGVDPDFIPAQKAHPALVVEDFDGFLTEMDRNGVSVTHSESLNGARRLHLSDPFGNRIEVVEALEC